MNYNQTDYIKKLIKYWRNTLADEDLSSIEVSQAPVSINLHDLEEGTLNESDSRSIQDAWEKYQSEAKRNNTTTDLLKEQSQDIPIIIFWKGYSPSREHGETQNRSSKIHYTFFIPALLLPTGQLSQSEGALPWVGRQYLNPNHEQDGSIPIIGDMRRYDEWLEKKPIENIEGKAWGEYIKWCELLWEYVSDNESLKGYSSLDEIRIDISQSVHNAGRNILQLYDVLYDSKNIPELIRKMCLCQGNTVQINDSHRNEYLSSLRGTMSAKHGLAASQSDAVAAWCMQNDSDILAVNGPPGTGKTTLIQSLVSSEVVKNAIEGKEPSILVGSSTNNEPILNINRSLNQAFENKDSPYPKLSKRWVSVVKSYGLYFPTSLKAEKAKKDGFQVAYKDKGNKWKGFPELEQDIDSIEKEEEYWLENYRDFSSRPLSSVQGGIEDIREKMASVVGKITKINLSLINYRKVKDWWMEKAHTEEITEYIENEKIKFYQKIQKAENSKQLCIKNRNEFDEFFEKEIELNENFLKGLSESIESSNKKLRFHTETLSSLKKAETSIGVAETFFELLGVMNGFLNNRKISRFLRVVSSSSLATGLFQNLLSNRNPKEWIDYAYKTVEEASREYKIKIQQYDVKNTEAQEYISELKEKKNKLIENLMRACKVLDGCRLEEKNTIEKLESKYNEYLCNKDVLMSDYGNVCEHILRYNKNTPEINSFTQEIPDYNDVNKVLDISYRHLLFLMAMRYWEGRWILEAKNLHENNIIETTGQSDTISKFRRWSMLTPCFVITAHSLPKFFRYNNKNKVKDAFVSDFMLEAIDLLIVDEAGQVGPHIGMSSFALSKKAVVIGDIHQLEPVSKVTEGTDYANANQLELGKYWTDRDQRPPHLVSEPKDESLMGSVMRLAQESTMVTSSKSSSDPGILLTEHWRCRDEIVSYCNELVYEGKLQPMSPARKKQPPIPPFAWAHVRGKEEKHGGSRKNEIEAQSIVEWVVSNKDAWCEHYGKAISEIVAIITPFKFQVKTIKSFFNKKNDQFKKITVGTVHSLQGAERPIVIFSPAYEFQEQKSVFFDKKPNMLNVAVSRAKDSFVVIGDIRLFPHQGNTPSAMLAKKLFLDSDNEITDVGNDHRFSKELLVQAERISDLTRHRSALKDVIINSGRNMNVLIASPWITIKALRDDNLISLMKDAIKNRGARILVVVDKDLYLKQKHHRGDEALRELENVGVRTNKVSRMHCKSIILKPDEIIEGSFNWLSASRDVDSSYSRHEVSWRITGEGAKKAIKGAIYEFKELGANVRVEDK